MSEGTNGSTRAEPPTIDLDGSDPSAYFRFGGATYEVANVDGLTLSQQKTLIRLQDRLKVLEAIDEPTPEDDAEYAATLRRVVAIALPGSPVEQLSGPQLAQVVAHFFVTSSRRRMEMVTAGLPTTTSGTSSPDSSASTAATP